MNPIDKAIQHAGSPSKLAVLARCSKQTLSNAIRRKSFSKALAKAISDAVEGTVSAQELIFWPESAEAEAAKPEQDAA